MNQNQGGNDARDDDDSALIDFLASLINYSYCMNFFYCLKTDFFIYCLNSYAFLYFFFPQIPDELVEHYLGKSGF